MNRRDASPPGGRDRSPLAFRVDSAGLLVHRDRGWGGLFDGAADMIALADLVHVDLRDSVRSCLRDLIAAGPGGADDFEVLARDGRTMLAVSCRAVGGPFGPPAVVGYVADVTAPARRPADRLAGRPVHLRLVR